MKLNAIDPDDMTLGEVEYFEETSGLTLDELMSGRITMKAVLAMIVVQQRRVNPDYSMDDARQLKRGDIEFEPPPEPKQPQDHLDPTPPAAKRRASRPTE